MVASIKKLAYSNADFGLRLGEIADCGISSKLKARKVIGSLISYCVRIAEEDNS
jgi:hypothetical protein